MESPSTMKWSRTVYSDNGRKAPNFSRPGFSMGCESLEDLDKRQVTVDLSCSWQIGSEMVEARWGPMGSVTRFLALDDSEVWTWGDSVTDQGVTVKTFNFFNKIY